MTNLGNIIATKINGCLHGEYKRFTSDGKTIVVHGFYHENSPHGEFISRNPLTGNLNTHRVWCHGKIIIDALENPHCIPTNPQERVAFKLKYGDLPLLQDLEKC